MDFDWEIAMAGYGGSYCKLDQFVSFTELKTVMDLTSCSVTYRSHAYVASVDVPLYAIGYPTKVYPAVWLFMDSLYDPIDWLPDPTDPSLARPEVDLSGEYVHTLTRTFETSSTYTWTYTSPYTANVPIGTKMPWVPILLILGAGLLSGIALVHQRRRSHRNPTEADTGPKDA